ncbi:MAG: 2-hydroxycyclohexanecarboxyl-CoA dehydrogenase [Thermoleophilales bacterium]|nr:2-hydroxycyclohexanecarboxyl-CoA dehydrogenase [Thermoleophilales bacterium]
MGRLDGRVALVTGAAQGIGAEVARRLAREGARVAVNDRVASPQLDAVVAEVGGIAAPADVSDSRQVGAMFDAVEEQLGDAELLVSNAAFMAMGPFPPDDFAAWWRQLDVNLSGTFFAARRAAEGMRRLGRGRIVVVSSYWGITGWPEATGYSASKGGLIALGKSLARELGPEGILTNVVAPGVIDSPQLEVDAEAAGVSFDEIKRRYAEAIPAGRVGTTAEVAATVAFLCSDGAGAFVGQVVSPNGGELR